MAHVVRCTLSITMCGQAMVTRMKDDNAKVRATAQLSQIANPAQAHSFRESMTSLKVKELKGACWAPWHPAQVDVPEHVESPRGCF